MFVSEARAYLSDNIFYLVQMEIAGSPYCRERIRLIGYHALIISNQMPFILKVYIFLKRISGASLKGRLLALPKYTRLSWKALTGTNALA